MTRPPPGGDAAVITRRHDAPRYLSAVKALIWLGLAVFSVDLVRREPLNRTAP